MRKSNWNGSFEESFIHASEGLNNALSNESNLKVEIVIAILVLIFAILFNVSTTELVMLIFSIGLVMVTELVNTAIEASVDASCFYYDKNAKYAKDLAAGSVIFSTTFAGLCGYIVFADNIYSSIKIMLSNNVLSIILLAILAIITLVHIWLLTVLLKKKNKISFYGILFAILLFLATYLNDSRIYVLAIILLLLSIILRKDVFKRKDKVKDSYSNYIISMYSGILLANLLLLTFFIVITFIRLCS